MGKPRKHAHRNWPDGLSKRARAGRTPFYVYRGPAADKEIYLGTDFEAAKKAVALVVAKRAEDPVQRVMSRIEKPNEIIADQVDWFRKNVLAERRSKRGALLSDATLANVDLMLRTFVARFGSQAVSNPDRRAISEFLREFPAQSSNKYRSLLKRFFDSARAEGLRDDNPVEGTAKREFVVQRQRLSKIAYDAIAAAADPWFKRALDLAFWSLQRREDLTRMHVDHWAEGKLSVRQKKVEGHGTGLIRITPGAQLRSAIIACLNSPERDPVVIIKRKRLNTTPCPYLLHRIPKARRKVEGRGHPGQLAAEMLSREFQLVRDRLNLFGDMPMLQRPSFHEIRALGADEYRNAGWSEEKVQALLGHASIDMTRLYLDRHGDRWVEVDAA